ncbi:fatty acid desaturase [Paenibacillus methanolicus]|uniref:Omega-6 fatty acid desaturase (Delta-12 desaturase) n=1 Tax=Paenibacillus methanolicus TaxID=582686 RepID=A0A5S5CI92_9BACL|nr:fatty acid desaturase [Paenibacillus methanolicus]TYP78222.1 omega-6 fatty acid desaturase (delta-12 desaturase) [Paenibacillus methanolicus]
MKLTPEYGRLRMDITAQGKPDRRKSIWQMVNTIIPFILLWAAAYLCLSVSVWITWALGIVAAGFLVRIFIIFHDCCHFSFFSSKRANAIVGTITGILTFFPYEQWKNEHAIHHATSGNLSRRGTGDIWTLTTDEYAALSFWKRLVYRLYRNPLVMFGLGPIYIFLVAYRVNRREAKRKERLNTYLTNVSIALMMAILCWTLGWQEALLVYVPILYVAGAAGIWLFYVQHQFEDTYFEHAEEWDYVSAAMQGSSYYKLPKILQWLTGNIGFHHIHHLVPQATNYRLEHIHQSHEVLRNVPAIGIRMSLQSLRYRLWDETNKRFVGFRAVRR